jgi:DNA-binding transcriptional LysR family regulator
LEYVLAVARELHFGRAAERVHVVQSSISRQVREVEAEVGFEIFRRNNHLVDLTDAEREFILAVGDMMARFDAEFKRARDLSRLIARHHAALCLIGYAILSIVSRESGGYMKIRRRIPVRRGDGGRRPP